MIFIKRSDYMTDKEVLITNIDKINTTQLILIIIVLLQHIKGE